jgi:hypothetical protein
VFITTSSSAVRAIALDEKMVCPAGYYGIAWLFSR